MITSQQMQLEQYIKHRCIYLKTRRMMYNMISIGQVDNLTSGQISWPDPTMPCCISVDQDKHIELVLSLHLVSIKRYGKKLSDLWRCHVTSSAQYRGQWCICRLKWFVNTHCGILWLFDMLLKRNRMNWNFAYWLIMGGRKIDLTWGHRYKKSEI